MSGTKTSEAHVKVLFVCRANVSRSQTAQAFFDRLSTHRSQSAGTTVGDNHGQTIREHLAVRQVSDFVFEILGDQGLDVSENERTQVTPAMVEEADRVIVMTERDSLPDYLLGNKKVDYWNIRDTLRQPYDVTLEVTIQIRRRVEALVEEIG